MSDQSRPVRLTENYDHLELFVVSGLTENQNRL